MVAFILATLLAPLLRQVAPAIRIQQDPLSVPV
jgi:hypothetical protein